MIRFERNAPPASPEQDETTAAVLALKRHMGRLLTEVSARYPLDLHTGSDYLTLYLGATDKASGLESGLLLHTDKTYGTGREPVLQIDDGVFGQALGSEHIACVYVEELSEDNFSVQELNWSLRQGPLRPWLAETGLSNTSVREIIGGHRDLLARMQQASRHAVDANDFLYFNGFADANKINETLNGIPASTLENLQPIPGWPSDLIAQS